MTIELRDVTGFRGEKIVELCLTDYKTFPEPLFRPAALIIVPVTPGRESKASALV